MIKINLTPIDELENRYWYLPDLAMAAGAIAFGVIVAYYFIGQSQDQVEGLNAKIASLEQSERSLVPELARFKNLSKSLEELTGKVSALKTLTSSKISKYKPVIVVEHLQNLKPDGLWFKKLEIGGTGSGAGPVAGVQGMVPGMGAAAATAAAISDSTFQITGQALDNILTAEFMTALRSTGGQEFDESDLRTGVYFAEISLADAQVQGKGGDGAFAEMAAYPEFKLGGRFAERTTPAQPATDGGNGKGTKANPPPEPKEGQPVLSKPVVSAVKSLWRNVRTYLQ